MENVYSKYGLKKVINASGKMTILGGSSLCDEVVEAMGFGATNFFEVSNLVNKTGEYISTLLNVEAACIVSSASSAIAMLTASMIVKDDLNGILNLHKVKEKFKREIVMPKGHNVDYGAPVETMISLGGGELVEAGYSNACSKEHVETMITDNTVALIYIKSHHCVQKGMLSIVEMVGIGKKYSLPVIVDAAAEEDLDKYYDMGVDVVIYSGTKALEGPTAALVVGKKKYIDNLKLQTKGIGRAMKVGKEGILGLTKAIEIYVNSEKATLKQQEEFLKPFINKIDCLDGVSGKVIRDGAGREILRGEISFDLEKFKDAKKIVSLLKSGEIAIYTRDYRANEGKIEIDVRAVDSEELDIIYNRIKEITQGGKNNE
jgi:L-seryl-tRNA(Ser) seleniumtransferase